MSKSVSHSTHGSGSVHRIIRAKLSIITLTLMLSGCLFEPRTYVEPPPSSVPRKPVSSPQTPAQSAAGVYTVRAGDTLYAIAFRHGLDYRELARWNQLVDPSRILVGQTLRLSAPPMAPVSQPLTSASPRPQPPASVPRPVNTAPAGSAPSARPMTSSSTSRPATVSEAIGVKAVSQPSTAPTPTSASAGPTITPVTETPELAEPQPLSSAPNNPSATTAPVASGTTPVATPLPSAPAAVPAPGTATSVASAPAPVATNTANPSSVATAPAPQSAHATAVATPINPNAPSKQVSGIRWRWPAEGKLIGRFVAGDPTESGIEIGGKLGQSVSAAADGEVVYSGNGLLGYGELIIIQHSPDFLSAYGHNQKRLVSEGTKVKAGQAIAEMGRQAGVDLVHFEIRQSGKPVDPLKFLP